MKIIGLAGTDASGKDTVGQILAKRYGWCFISVTDILRAELKRRNIELKREYLRLISAEWRRKFGPAVLIDKALKEYKPVEQEYNGLVISSLRHPAEADRIHELEGMVVWTDADPKVRYERVLHRNRGSEDHVTFEQFVAEEQAQMHHSGDDATLSLAEVKAKADIFLENNTSNIEDLNSKAETALKNAKKLN